MRDRPSAARSRSELGELREKEMTAGGEPVAPPARVAAAMEGRLRGGRHRRGDHARRRGWPRSRSRSWSTSSWRSTPAARGGAHTSTPRRDVGRRGKRCRRRRRPTAGGAGDAALSELVSSAQLQAEVAARESRTTRTRRRSANARAAGSRRPARRGARRTCPAACRMELGATPTGLCARVSG